MKIQSKVMNGAVLSFLLSSCVPLDQIPPEKRAGLESPKHVIEAGGSPVAFGELDPGATEVTTLHFTLRGYSENELRPLSSTVESLYNKISTETGLYSYLAAGHYKVVVYRDRDEYLQKTRLPEWTRAVAAGDTLYMYPGIDVEPVLAHEMTHLLFNSFMGESIARNYRWISEGLAMIMELHRMSDGDRGNFMAASSRNLRERRVPFSQMTFFVPISEEKRTVDVWYQQVRSVTDYLLDQGSTLNFSGFLAALHNGVDVDRALADNYPGKFRSLQDLEAAWKHTV